MEEKVSETAVAIASLRALSNYELETTVQSRDELAELFLPEDRRGALCTPESRAVIKQHIPKGMYEYVIARTRYFDDVFIRAINDDIDQIVLLGAGYDSRPYRFDMRTDSISIFELDTKPTQEHKIECLRKHNVDIRPNISFIPTNFETDDPINLLGRYGYDKRRRTLFLWEGVTFYLSPATVSHMLRRLNEDSGTGSRVVFDFQTMRSRNDLIETGLQDETIKFGIESGKTDQFVENHHYRVVELVTAAEMEQRFLTLRNGELFGKIMPIMNFLLIEHE
ncbi:SAM-dependent methyltransferase [Marispirochaeta sp.]|uniref:class I SAM-dependent methyltransferase n=1 Tax=Marispirochaeta sp. TaxID=2038653 RepID=UPI0029C876E3|nr:SAM-dependent methyltransferase [Marispirochaeta sp.]